MPAPCWFIVSVMSEEEKETPPEQEKERKVVLNERPVAQVKSPALWLVLLSLPVVFSLFVGMVKSNQPTPTQAPSETTPSVQPAEPSANINATTANRSRFIGRSVGQNDGRKFSIADGGYVRADENKTQEQPELSCDFSPWVGKKLEQKMLNTLKNASSKERPFRILPPGSAMTMDHNPARVNFDLDEAGTITRIWCG